MALFNWPARRAAVDAAALGAHAGDIAVRLADGDSVPDGAVVVIFDAGNRARRGGAARVALARGESAWCYHPGPYGVDLTPYAQAPELGLRLQFAIDAADPLAASPRFELYLLSEASAQPRLAVARFGAALQAALQLELAQGNLELPPCTSLDEWHAFRAGLNQLCYTRFGVTVDDCVPVDLGESVDFAAILQARAQAAPLPPAAAAAPAAASATPQPPASDAGSLRRLFLELPAAASALRLLALPPGRALFQAHGRLLQRLDLASLNVATMPSLEWAAPDQALAAVQQSRRRRDSGAAARALDEAWALLARLQLAAPAHLPALLDEADRILSNLEHSLELRRAPFAPPPQDQPREPA
ncbi:pyruvate/2-oxoglutarate dehydrogenase complex dihydrolipoamide acyltransferase (E2) component [Janthinobacterium sp. CG_23.3]|uniref:hypothetical protein n=1 Tax=Janthinobacterium sp. CG_23.3 TaxID=3349634 RepID=UPI0038D3B6BB